MFYCNDCNAEFEEPKVYQEFHGLTEPPYEERWACPNCGSNDFVAMVICKVCGECIIPGCESDQDDEIHRGCAEETFGEWDKIKTKALNSNFSEAQIQFSKDCEVA